MGNFDRSYARLSNPKLMRVRGRAESTVYAVPTAQGLTISGQYVITSRRRTKEVVAWALVKPKRINLPKLNFLYHYFGLYPRVSVAWEFIPLSFLIDMVIDVGSYLRQFELGPIQVEFETVSSGYSVKSTDTHNDQQFWSFNNTSDLTGPAHVPGATGTYRKSQYIRVPGPIAWGAENIAPIQVGLPSLGQLGTIGEMVYLAFGRHNANQLKGT